MILLKVAPIFMLALLAAAEKKIELQDIEEDNLKSENEKDFGDTDARSQGSAAGSTQGLVPLEFLKSGILRLFENSPQQQTRYIHQYDVTEPPEKLPSAVEPKPQYGPSAHQQAMVGYLSNVPMQIYLVPQYYNEQSGPVPSPQPNHAYSVPRGPYPTSPEAVQTQTNYIEVPAYVGPGGKTYVQQYTPPVTYVSYSAQPVTPAPTVASVITYQMPAVQYTPTIVAPTSPTQGYHYQAPQYTDTNTVEEVHENQEEASKQYTTQSEVSYSKAPTIPDYHRYYTSHTPHRDEYRHSPISELPPPNPLILKASPPHLSHIPKALPIYRPQTKPVYNAGGHAAYTQRPSEPYGPHYKRRPTSLLDSYIPSSVQIEYLKRGLAKNPLDAYEALSSGRHLLHSHNGPRHYERGFLPNQMYHTAAGGVTFGHYKRSPKVDKV